MKLEQFEEKINKLKEEVILPEKFKSETRGKLLNFIELRPLAPRIQKTSISILPFIKPMPVLAGVLVLMVGTMGISFAAEKSLPGQLLYPIKVSFNEEVIGALRVGESRGEWDAKRVERRLIESNKLTLENGIKEENKIELEEKFELHSNKVSERIAIMEEKGKVRDAADLASRFETSLRAHEQIIEKMEERGVASPLGEKLKEKLARIEAKRLVLEAEIEVEDQDKNKTGIAQAAAEGKIKAAQNVVKEVSNFLEIRKGKMSVEAFAEAESRLKLAEDSIAQAKSNMEKKLFGEAFNFGNEAIKIAQQSKLLVEARLELNLVGDTQPSFSAVSVSLEASSTPTSTDADDDSAETDD